MDRVNLRISRRWAILFITCFLFILSQFYRASVAVISPNLIEDIGLHPQGLGLVSAAFFYAFAITQIPILFTLDSLGPRITMTALTMVAVAGALFFALGDGLGDLVIGRALLGIGMACNLMGTLKLITLWFGPLRFATLSALVVSIGTAGNIFAATPLVLMVAALGWRMTFTVFAGVNLLLALLFFAVVRDRPQIPPPDLPEMPSAPRPAQTLKSARSLFAEKDYWIISLGTFCRYGIFAAVQALWAGPFLMTVIEVSPVTAGNLLLLMSVGVIGGSPFWGWASDTGLNARKPVVIGGLAGMLIILSLFCLLSPGAGRPLLVALFFGFGFFSSAGQVMYPHIKERMPIEHAGMAMTGINFFTMTGVAVFLQGLGSLMERIYPAASLGPEAFRTAFLFCCGCLAATAAIYLMTRETRGAKKLTPKGR